MFPDLGYLEVTEELVTEGLETCLHAYNYKMGQKLNLVFFRQAMLHMARLSRVLAMPGGHGVLIGLTHSTGRTTLVRLASFVAHCKVSFLSFRENGIIGPTLCLGLPLSIQMYVWCLDMNIF